MGREKLAQVLFDFFGFNDKNGTYTYDLTRCKTAFGIGTMSLDDFEELTEERIYELADYIIENVKKKEE